MPMHATSPVKSPPRKLLLRALPVLLLMAWSTSFAEDVSISEFVVVAKQTGPVQIVAIRLPDTSQDSPHYPVVLIHNSASTAVADFRVGDYLGDPRGINHGGLDTSYLGTHDHMDSQSLHVIPANGETDINLRALTPYNLAFVAHQVQSNCLQVALYVSKVQFADGTTWQQNLEQAKPLWADTLTPHSTEACDGSSATQDIMKRIVAVSYSAATAQPPGVQTVVQSYTVKCPVRTINGAVTAVCDW